MKKIDKKNEYGFLGLFKEKIKYPRIVNGIYLYKYIYDGDVISLYICNINVDYNLYILKYNASIIDL